MSKNLIPLGLFLVIICTLSQSKVAQAHRASFSVVSNAGFDQAQIKTAPITAGTQGLFGINPDAEPDPITSTTVLTNPVSAIITLTELPQTPTTLVTITHILTVPYGEGRFYQINNVDNTNGVITDNQVVPTPVLPPSPAPTLPPVYEVGVVSQDDLNQYANVAQFRSWHGNVCSAASIASVLVAYGFPVKLGDVLQVMINTGSISSWSGVHNNGFEPTAQQFGLHAIVDTNSDLDSHFGAILSQIQTHNPVIVNVRDGYYYPTGHFLVAYHLNDNGTLDVMNPDWHGKLPPGLQTWPIDQLRLYFSRTMLSVRLSR